MQTSGKFSTAPRRALVVGLGIAGMATAMRLSEIGWEVTVVERSAARRTGGYFIALFGLGRASAERLGIDDLMPDRADRSSSSWEVTRTGRRSPGMNFKDMPNQPRLLLRGDVEQALFARLPASVEVRYATTPTRISQDALGVSVSLFSRATGAETTHRYDLVVGADGIHSTVRRLTFGPDANFVRPLGYMIGATLLDAHLPGFGSGDSIMLAEPGRSMSVFGFADRAPGLMFSYRTRDAGEEFHRGPGESLRAAFGPEPTGDLLGSMIDFYDRAEDRLFDEAAQVSMMQWYSNRVVLVGDAAWCMTLYSGLGASSGLAGADLLGTMLERHQSMDAALREWNDRIRPYVHRQHRNIDSMRTMFTPADHRAQLGRKVMIRMMASPVGRSVMDRFGAEGGQLADKDIDLAAR